MQQKSTPRLHDNLASPVSRDPAIAVPGSRLTGLRFVHVIAFACHWEYKIKPLWFPTVHPISHQPGWLDSCNTSLKVISAQRSSPANRASPAHVIRPLPRLGLGPSRYPPCRKRRLSRESRGSWLRYARVWKARTVLWYLFLLYWVVMSLYWVVMSLYSVLMSLYSVLIPLYSVLIPFYYSTNCNTIQIWSWCSRYPSSVGDGYPAIYVASYVGRKSEVKKCWQKDLKMLRAWKSSLLSICWIIKQLSCSILRNIVWF